ncbi:2-succinylbenzoate--CoA ligase, chloroplastic/peroxisomal-like protein [Drosera capensis]
MKRLKSSTPNSSSLGYSWAPDEAVLVYLHTAPLCHIGGISSAMAILITGGCHVLMPKFESTAAIEAVERDHVTSFITVPTMMADLISALRLKKTWEGTESVKKILNRGGSLAAKLLEDVITFFPYTKIFSAYVTILYVFIAGLLIRMTETCSSLTFMLLYDPKIEKQQDQKTSDGPRSNHILQLGGICVGKPAPHIEIMVDHETASSDRGRILTRGPHVMLGYWSQSSFMVEAVLSQHPGIYLVVVVGLAHRHLSEIVIACIQLKEDWEWSDGALDDFASSRDFYLTGGILKQHCRDKDLTGFNVPKMFILWRKPFPLTSTGKLRRDQVKSEATQLVQFLHSSL